MNSSKFLQALSKTYKQILFEQDIPSQLASPAPAASPAASPAAPPAAVPPAGAVPPPAQAGDAVSDVEQAKPVAGPIGPEAQAFLIGLLAQSIFLDLGEEEKYQIKNMQARLSDQTAPQIELEIVKKIKELKGDNYEMLDINQSLFEMTPRESNEFVNFLVKHKIIKEEELKSGGGEVYLLNLIITALMRTFDITEKGKVMDILEHIGDKRIKKESRKWEKIIDSQIEKYGKV
jgi:hypothetical protein